MRPASSDFPLIDRRSLNRASLARQHLLERADLSAKDVVDELVGIQAQNPWSPHVALWSPVEGYDTSEVDAMFEERRVVRVGSLRNTIHLLSSTDAPAVRAWCQPVADRQFKSTQFAKDVAGIDLDKVASKARTLLETEPLTNAQLGAALQQRWPDVPRASLAQVARFKLALVQVPPRGMWGASHAATSTTVEHWLGTPLPSQVDVEALIRRFLSVYGPASVKDAQAWSGLTRLNGAFHRLRPDLMSFRDEYGVELFDLPDAPRPAGSVPAPPRFLPDYENALISYADRRRFMPDEPFIADLGRGALEGTILVDGVLDGMWRIRKEASSGQLVASIRQRRRGPRLRELRDEAERFAAFLATGYDVDGAVVEQLS